MSGGFDRAFLLSTPFVRTGSFPPVVPPRMRGTQYGREPVISVERAAPSWTRQFQVIVVIERVAALRAALSGAMSLYDQSWARTGTLE